ncbi:MAG: hypothetical protein WEF53_13160 [Bacteroidota bacterium]
MITKTPISFFFLFAIAACNQEGKEPPAQVINLFESIAVGMTYDEVEKLIGKPIEIDRGISKLESSEDSRSDIPYGDADFLERRKQELEFRLQILGSGERTYPQHLQSVGSVLYVNWRFDESRVDTIRFIHPVWQSRSVSLDPFVEYFVNGKKVPKDEFELVGDTAYWGPARMFLYSKEDWQQQKDLRLSVSPPEVANKEIRKSPRSKKQFYIVPDTVYQAVISRYSVIFDAASGRVTTKGFIPYQVITL